MDVLHDGNVVKSTTSEQLMVINSSYIDKVDFNKEVFNFMDDKDPNDRIIYRYICNVEQPDGTIKKLEFKRDELIFVRAKY